MQTQTLPSSGGYLIRTKGHLTPALGDWLGGLKYENLEQGDALLYLASYDQAALYGLLNRLRDAGIRLLSVTLFSPGVADQGDQ